MQRQTVRKANKVTLAAIAAIGSATLLAACVARLPTYSQPAIPAMPSEQQIMEMVNRSRGTPDLPTEQAAPGTIQVVFQTGHAAAINAVALSADGRYILTSSRDETAKLWDVASGQVVRTFTGIDQFSQSVGFVGTTRRIVVHGLIGAKVFDAETGRVLPILDDLDAGAVVSSNGRFGALSNRPSAANFGRAASKKDSGLAILDLTTDQTVATIPVDVTTGPVALSDDGRLLIVRRMVVDSKAMTKAAREGRSVNPETHIDVWDVTTRKFVRELPLELTGATETLLSPDARWLAVQNFDQTVSLIDVATGTTAKTLVPPRDGLWAGTNSLVFSPDGRMLGLSTQEGNTVIWELPSGRELKRLQATAINFSADATQIVAGKTGSGAPFLRDLSGGSERPLSAGGSEISELALVGDGQAVVAATETGGARLWSLATGELLRTFACPGGGSTHSVSVSASQRWVAAGCRDGGAYVWNLDTGAPVRTLVAPTAGQYTAMTIVRFDPAGRRVLVAKFDDLSLWEVATGRQLRQLTLPDGPTNGLMDEKSLRETAQNLPESQRDAYIKMSSNPDMQKFDQMIRAVAFHPDGQRVAVAKAAGLSLWDLTSGTRAREYSAAAARQLETPDPAKVSQEALMKKMMSGGRLSSAEMKQLMSMQTSGAMQMPGMRDSDDEDAMLEAAGLNLEMTMHLAFSADGNALHTLTARGPRAWNVETGARIRVAKAPINFADPNALSMFMEDREIGQGAGIAVSNDGRLGARGLGRVVKLWDIATGKPVADLVGHTADISSLAFLADGRTLASGGRDGALRLWSVPQGKPIVQLVAFGATDYMAVTPDQFYRTSRRGIGGVAFRIDDRVYPFEQFDLRFNRPHVILERLGRTSPDIVQGYRLAYERRLKKLGFSEQKLSGDLHLPQLQLVGAQLPVNTPASELTLRVKASDDQYALDRINVFVNDVPVFGTAGMPIADRAARQLEQDIQVPLVSGRNKIQVSVLNSQGTESLRQTSYTTSTAVVAPPDIYVVAIGVSRYQREAYNLRFAAKDAADLMNAYGALGQQGGAVGQVHVLDLTDSKATRTSIRGARSWLQQAKVNDLVVLFAAGHGMTDQQSNYYFGTYDIDPEQPADRGLPYEEFEALLDGIPALQKLMLIDTCFSGEIDKEEPVVLAQQTDTGGAGTIQMRAFKAARGVTVVADNSANAGTTVAGDALRFQQELFADLRRGTGAVVISSASGNEYALEGDQWANGVFTYALLDGLKNGRADSNGDSIINVSELQTYVLDQVRRLTAGGQNPTVRRENLDHDFRVY